MKTKKIAAILYLLFLDCQSIPPLELAPNNVVPSQ